MEQIQRTRIVQILGTAVAMTMLAELIYFIVWGIALFPSGNLIAKLAWTTACGVGMGAVIGVGVLVLSEGRVSSRKGFWLAALIMFVVGTACTIF